MRYFLSLLLSCSFMCAFGQDPIAEKMKWYGKAKSTASLFVHFDKNVYSNNETVYFTGYLLNQDSTAIKRHHVLAIALIRDADTTVIAHDKFLLENGLAFGNIKLIDSILTGNYHFIAYTDKTINGIPEAIFTQPITLKTNIDPFFKASMKLIDDQTKSSIKKVVIAVTSKDSRFLPKPTSISYRYGNINTTTKTDLSGQLLLALPAQKNLIDPNLYVKLKYGKDSSFISMAIPFTKNKANVKFYPEGGNLISGIPSTIGWEVKDQQRMPVALKAFLYRNNVVIDTIETSSYGIGKFRIFPQTNAIYALKLVHSALADSMYTLPKALTEGLVMSIPKAVSNDTLRVILKTNSVRSLHIRIHNFQRCFLIIPFKMDQNGQVIKIPLNEVPKGLITITVTDSLERPLAERLFFAHYNQKEQINIASDKEVYNQREKINFKIRLADSNSQGIVSIACVQNNRLDLKKAQDIVSYTYLTSELNILPVQLMGNPMADLNYLEQILLVKGWRKYNWQELEKVEKKSVPLLVDSLVIEGNVTHPRKKLGQTSLITVGGAGLKSIVTDTNGHFKLRSDQLLAIAEKKLYLIFENKDKINSTNDYRIKIKDSYQAMNIKLSKLFDTEIAILPSTLENNQALILKNNERAIQLKEVVIIPKGDNLMTYNSCGDYICLYNILNCPNHIGHPNNKPPIKGRPYTYQGAKIIYEGCNTPDESVFFSVKPVYLNKEFYINDFHDPLEPAFVSTIYWNYGVFLNGKKEATLNFYTSDITGRFRLVIQGILNNDVVYAEKFFEVKGKP